MVTAPGIIEVVPIVQATVDINLTPRFYRHDPLDLHPDISISDCLSLLHLVAIGCAEIESQIRTFWQSMGSEFVYMTLHYNQPLDQILHMIDVLQTSVLKNSFGPISGGNEQEQRISENGILSQLTALLMDSPIAVEDSQNPDEGELAKLRLDVLGLLSVICRNEHGGEVMASHPSVVGRLVHVIHDELDTLYDYRHGHEKSAQQINLATRILYHLLTRHSKHVNLKEKLSIIPGGTQKHLVCLTRLAMSRGLVLEAGIEDQVAGCAQRLLEDFVTPEEGEALIAAFSLSKT
ncbi:MAG: hypothetical protein M1817_005173 [Caeruleum heppii]|nr:MAG: hypothetical protein M1817_005173 [Caeruleum heppii]